ncbi:MAG TPA: TetR family transcriptional regulator [Acidimicrobiales bacterium]|nr:TetR family transcriptional regulator [Acidimicrobiales bacterium]
MASQKSGTELQSRPPEAGEAVEAETVEGRRMRADARRNRELLVAAAHDVFASQGAGASMEAIAKEAGVGVGTLYRHFPNRLDLVEAVYQTDVEELWETAQRVVAELEPWPAVEAFFVAFRRYAHTKQALMAELHQAFEKNPDMRSRARGRIEASFDLVIERAKEAGVVRGDVSGSDVVQLVGPVCTNTGIEPGQAARLLGMVLDGIRADGPRTALA